MTVRGQWMLVLVVVALITGGVWAAMRVFGDEFAQVSVGSEAPAFAGMTVDSVPARRSLADYDGQVTLVNIWATWCIPCEKEMPMLQRLHADYRDRGLRVVAVSVDSPGMEDEIRRFVLEYGLTFDVIHDADARIKLDYMTTGVPESFLIGKDGVIRYKQIAAIDAQDDVELRRLIDQLLAERE
jgi:thiol-disulfide isomerase/thioredoxin